MPEPMPPAQLSDFENNWDVLLKCTSPSCDPQFLSGLLHSVDWPRLLALAEDHGVIGHLAAAMSDIGPAATPPGIKLKLLEMQRSQNFLTLRLTAELFRVLELFVAKNIPVLVVKGPVLAMQAYGDPATRSYGDLDLLVRQRDVRSATEAMLASGYQAAVPLSAIDAGKIPGQYLFTKADSSLLVELHSDFTLRYFPRRLPIEDFFARQICVRVDAHEVPSVSVEDQLVLICVHGAKHFWDRLSWIADVAALVTRQTAINWDRAWESAKAVRAKHLLNAGLRLAADLLCVRLPEKVSARVQSDASATKLVEGILRWLPAAGWASPNLFERAVFRLRMRGGLLAAPAYLLRLSLSPTEEDWQADGQISHNHFLDVLRRPLRLARKHGRSPRE